MGSGLSALGLRWKYCLIIKAMRTAYLFPGQGAQFVGMGADLYHRYPQARARFDAADDLLGFSLTSLMFGDGGDPEVEAEALRQTEVTQPALYVHSMAIMAVLAEAGMGPAACAGHSLGEYSALAASGALTFEDGLRMVRLRGQAMAEAGTRRRGTMAAVLGLDDTAIAALCEAVSTPSSIVQPANYNAPGQVVVSGDVEAIDRIVKVARDHGARRVVPLSVSGAFHSPLMEHARQTLSDALAHLVVTPPHCPVYINVTARPVTEPEIIRKALLDQLTSPVLWSQTLIQMRADEMTQFVEIGAGKVLSGLVRRTLDRKTPTTALGTVETLSQFLDGVSS